MLFARWSARYGYRHSLKIGLPLVVSMLSSTVMTFTDRVFLGNYSLDALAAALPANLAAFLFLSFFFGVVEYVGVFVAQYTGAERSERVGAALWQGLWFCLPSGVFLAALWFIAEPLFALGGHPPHIMEQEVAYFRILTLGGGPFIVGICLSSFYSGRGMTKPVMLVNMAAAGVNVPLNYCLIFGYGPFPELGIVGAALATLVGYCLPAFVFAFMVFTRDNEALFGVRSAWRLDRSLFGKFMRFGLPGGAQFFIDIFAVSFFVFIVGRIGEAELAATNIAISLDTLSFLPMIGMHIAASVMVGQAMGAHEPDNAAYATHSVLHIALIYMGTMGAVFLLFPEPLVNLYLDRAALGAQYDEVVALGTVMLRYVALFTLIDAVAITYMGGLKGAGDTRYIMGCMGVGSVGFMAAPLLALEYFDIQSFHGPWLCLVAYVGFLAVAFMRRFRGGVWRRIELVDDAPGSD